MRKAANENNSLVLELESLVTELHDMMNRRIITEAERLDLKDKIVELIENG